MKKAFSATAVLVAFALFFAGCFGSFNIDKNIQKLEEKGFTISEQYTDHLQLAEINSLLNSSIELDGGDLMVALSSATVMVQTNAPHLRCVFLEFSNESDASAYSDFGRITYTDYVFARSGTVVIITNSEIAQETVDLDFQ